MHGSDYVVRDVCAKCNNERLSALDQYFCTLYDEYFSQLRDFSSTLTFKYDFDLLARSLLKIIYTSARVAGSDTTVLRKVRSYIRGTAFRPRQLAVFIEVVSPTLMPTPDSGGQRKVFHQMYRSTLMGLTIPGGEKLQYRIVAIYSFCFHILLPASALSDGEYDSLVETFAKYIDGTYRLDSTQSAVAVSSSRHELVSSIEPHLRSNWEKYSTFFRRKRSPES